MFSFVLSLSLHCVNIKMCRISQIRHYEINEVELLWTKTPSYVTSDHIEDSRKAGFAPFPPVFHSH